MERRSGHSQFPMSKQREVTRPHSRGMTRFVSGAHNKHPLRTAHLAIGCLSHPSRPPLVDGMQSDRRETAPAVVHDDRELGSGPWAAMGCIALQDSRLRMIPRVKPGGVLLENRRILFRIMCWRARGPQGAPKGAARAQERGESQRHQQHTEPSCRHASACHRASAVTGFRAGSGDARCRRRGCHLVARGGRVRQKLLDVDLAQRRLAGRGLIGGGPGDDGWRRDLRRGARHRNCNGMDQPGRGRGRVLRRGACRRDWRGIGHLGLGR